MRKKRIKLAALTALGLTIGFAVIGSTIFDRRATAQGARAGVAPAQATSSSLPSEKAADALEQERDHAPQA